MITWTLARKYFFSRRLPKTIHIISLIAALGIFFGTVALIVVLSIFNGFYVLIHDLFQSFDPHLKVSVVQGKYFIPPNNFLVTVQSIPEIEATAYTLEGKAMLKYHDKQTVVIVKGVDEEFLKVSKVNTVVKYGQFSLESGYGDYRAVLGMGVAYFTQANLKDELTPMQLFTVSPTKDLTSETADALILQNVFPIGIFSLQKDYDDKLVIVHKKLAEKLFEAEGKVSAIEIRLKDLAHLGKVKERLQQILGKDYKVQTYYEQHESMFKVMENEKRFSYIVLALLMLIAAINIVGSLALIVAHKRRDIGVFMTLGLSRRSVQWVFMQNGLMITLAGLVPGLLVGILIVMLQSQYGFIKLKGGESFIIDYYPMALQAGDLITTALTVLFWGLLASWYPAYSASQTSPLENIKN